MVRSLRALVVVVALFGAAAAVAATSASDHVCADGEGVGACPTGQARYCASASASVRCGCPGGAIGSGTASCTPFASSAPPPKCAVAASSLGVAIAGALDFAALANPTLPRVAPMAASQLVAADDPRWTTLSYDALAKLAGAHEALEGAATAEMADTLGAKRVDAQRRRDFSVDRAIEVMRSMRVRFPKEPSLSTTEVSLARALLRRAAYGVAKSASTDRDDARLLLEAIYARGNVAAHAGRDAAFILGELAVRDAAWTRVASLDAKVVEWTTPSRYADDPAFTAAAWARVAHARIEMHDLASAKGALLSALDVAVTCAPRTECVTALAGVRAVLGETWIALGEPARSLAVVCAKGSAPRRERVRPLLRFADVASSAKSGACDAAAEEARGWSQIVK
jgi:hypothetical protein